MHGIEHDREGIKIEHESHLSENTSHFTRESRINADYAKLCGARYTCRSQRL